MNYIYFSNRHHGQGWICRGGWGVRPPLQQPDPPPVWQYGMGGGASRPRLRGPRMTDPPTDFLTNPTLITVGDCIAAIVQNLFLC
jgi:hypothetical protein